MDKTNIETLHGVFWNSHDLEQKFSNSFFVGELYKEGGKKNPLHKGLFYIKNASWEQNGGVGILCRYIVGASQQEAWIPYKGAFITEERPSPCITTIGKSAYIFTYNPDRQWRRGFCVYNSYIHSTPSFTKDTHWGWEVAESVANPKHYSLEEALKEFKEDKGITGRALNNSYFLLRKATSPKEIRLYRHFTFLGTFLGNKFLLRSDASIFSEELRMEIPLLRKQYAA